MRPQQDRDRRSRRRGGAARGQRPPRRHGERRRPRALRARLRARRPDRHPLRQPRRISRGLLRHHARRPGRRAGQLQFPRQTIHFILRDAGARLVFCDRPRCRTFRPDLPSVHFGGTVRGFDRFLDPGAFEPLVPGARAGDVPLHLGLDRGAEGRRALAPEPHLGGGDAAGARSTATAI